MRETIYVSPILIRLNDSKIFHFGEPLDKGFNTIYNIFAPPPNDSKKEKTQKTISQSYDCFLSFAYL